MELRNERPLAVQILQKAEQSPLLKPAVNTVKSSLVETLGL